MPACGVATAIRGEGPKPALLCLQPRALDLTRLVKAERLTSVSFCLQPQTYRIYPCAVCGYFLNGKIERTLYIEIIKEYTSKSSKKKSNYRLVKK
jgi:hypothetical protein